MSCYLIVFIILSPCDTVHLDFLVTVVSRIIFCVAMIMKVLRNGCHWYESRMNCVVSCYFNDRFHIC